MAKANEPENKAENKAAASKEVVAVKTEQTKSATVKKKPVAEKAKAPVKPAAAKAATSKEVTVKTQQTKVAPAKKKPASEKAKAPAKKAAPKAAQGKDVTVKTEDTKNDSEKKKPVAEEAKTAVKKTADKAKKTKSAFAKKMGEVKGTAEDIGQKIADVAKDASEKSDTLEDRITAGLQGMKKDIHRVAASIAEKTKEK